MSTTVERTRREPDIASQRPTPAKSRPSSTKEPVRSEINQNDSVDKRPEEPALKESEPSPSHGRAGKGLYTSVDEAQKDFQQKALEHPNQKSKEEEEEENEQEGEEEEEDEEEDEEEEKAARAEKLKEGEENLKYRDQAAELPPDEYSRMYAQLYPTIRNSWSRELSGQHHERMKRVNEKIRAQNKIDGRNEKDFEFPYREILEHVAGSRFILEKIRRLDMGSERTKEAEKMLSGHTFFSEWLRKRNIDLKLLIPKEIRDELDTIYQKSGLEKEREKLNEMFRRPTVKQEAILAPALKFLASYYDFVEDEDTAGMNNTLEKIKDVNEALRKSNLDEGLKEDDHVLPVDHLRAINIAMDQENMEMSHEEKTELIRDSNKRVKAGLKCLGLNDAAVPEKCTEGDPLPEEELRRMQQDASNYEGEGPQEKAEDDAVALVAEEQRHGQQSAGGSSSKSMSLPVPRPIVSPGIREGVTDCGKVISVAKAGFGYRVFTNIGTDAVPVCKMFTGSNFPKSVRSALYEKFSSKSQPSAMKDEDIEIWDTVEHPVKNGSYTWVVYLWKGEPDPKPRIMSHTDLVRRLGRDAAVRQEDHARDARKKRLEILRRMGEFPDEVIVEGIPRFNECAPYMADGLKAD